MKDHSRLLTLFSLVLVSSTLSVAHGKSPQRKVASGSDELPVFPYKSICAPNPTPYKFNDALEGKTYANYPRKNVPLYRGIKNDWEITPAAFIQSSVDNTIYYQSWAYQLYKKEFLSQNDQYTSARLEDYLDYHDMLEIFRDYKTCLDNLPKYKEQEAGHLAAKLIDDTLTMHQKNRRLDKRYLNYGSKKNVDYVYAYPGKFSNKDMFIGRGEVIFSALSAGSANSYATTWVTGFKDHQDRALDLNYYNYERHHGNWTHNGYDADEFIQAGYYASEDIRLLQKANGYQAYLKTTFKGVPMVLLVSSHDASAIINTDNFFDTNSYTPHTLYGVFQLCDKNKACGIPGELIKKFSSFERTSPDGEVMRILGELDYNGKVFQFATKGDALVDAQGTVIPAPIVQKVKVTKAVYGLIDVTTKAQEFCLDKVKTSCDYKIRQKFVFDTPKADYNEAFTMEWECSPSGKKQSAKIDAPAEGKTISLTCN